MAKVSCFQSRTIRRALRSTPLRQVCLRCCVLILILFSLTSFPHVVQAHSSGPPRLADVAAGPYRLFVWTQPEPLRVGDAHISILVTQANQPVNDAHVQVQFTPIDQVGQSIVVTATAQDFLSNIYYEADVQLPSTGNWRATINIEGAVGNGSIEFESAVLSKKTLNWPLVGGAAGLLVLLLGLIGVWSRMQAKEASSGTRVTRPRPMRTEIK
ncbi:hypothetical protein BH10CHL1_BH10CHL1_37580 [soil metagenome]